VTDQQQPARGTGPDPASGEQEPNASGTVFLMVLFLMATAGLWLIMYLMLLNR
jgi:hypothetical protein